ncbi:MAG: hypothetical protein ABJA89_17280, partial [Lapillicoccus sp.]
MIRLPRWVGCLTMRHGRLVVSSVRIAAGLFVLLVGVLAFAVAMGPGRNATYAAASESAAVLMLATCSALVAAGLATSFGRRSVGPGDLAVLVGLAWAAAPLVGWSQGPPAVRAAALVVSLLTVPLILHLGAAGDPGRRPVVRSTVVLAYAVTSAVAVVQTLFRDPYVDQTCFANCSVNPFLIHSFPDLVRAVEVAQQWFLASLGLLLVGLSSARLARGPGPARRQSAPIAVPAVAVGVVVVVRSLVTLARPVEDPSDAVLFTGYVIASATLLALAAGLGMAAVVREARRLALSRFVTVLAGVPAAGALEAALGAAVNDPDLRLGYFAQHTVESLHEGQSPIDHLRDMEPNV